MFFKKKIDGKQLGYDLANHISEQTRVIDGGLEKKLMMIQAKGFERTGSANLNDLSILQGKRLFSTVINSLEHRVIWILSVSEALKHSSTHSSVIQNKINEGFEHYILEQIIDGDLDTQSHVTEIRKKIRIALSDSGLNQSKYPPEAFESFKASESGREAISISELTVEEGLLPDLSIENAESVVSRLALEFSTLLRFSKIMVRKFKVV